LRIIPPSCLYACNLSNIGLGTISSYLQQNLNRILRKWSKTNLNIMKNKVNKQLPPIWNINSFHHWGWV
jgi:hypothetical protein